MPTKGCRKDFTGAVFKYIKVIRFLRWTRDSRQVYLAEDIFGARCEVESTHFIRKGFGTKLCSKESVRKRSRLRGLHWGMVTRCHNKRVPNYLSYGARGITVCREWRGKGGFHRFLMWSLANGYKDGLSIDRIDPDKGYSPDNCRYITLKENLVRRRNVFLDWVKVAIIRAAWVKRKGSGNAFFRRWAAIFKCSPTVIQAVVYRKTWANE